MMNLQNLRMKRILRILIVVFVFLYFLSFFSTHVCAENNFELEKYFETVRGQLLSFYNAEVTAHAGIILGLLVALGSIGKDGIKALFSNKKFSRCLSLFAFIIIIFFILVKSGC